MTHRSTGCLSMNQLLFIICLLAISAAPNKLRVQCPPPPPPPFPNGAVEGQVSGTAFINIDASVAMDDFGTGRFIVAWVDANGDASSVSVLRFDEDGNCLCCPVSVTPPGLVSSALPSVAMSRGSNVAVGLLCVNRLVGNSDILDVSSFNFDMFMPPIAQPIASIVGDHEPSMGISDLPGGVHAAAWSNDNDVMGFPGMLYKVQGLAPAAIRPCNPSGGNVCFVEETFFTPTAWQPALWQRSDGGHSGPVLHDSRNKMTGWRLL